MRTGKIEIDLFEIAIIGVIVLFIGTILFAAVANESNRIDAGIIVDKHYQQAYTTTSYRSVGKTTVPQTEYHPATYSFTIKGDKDGETVQYCFAVTELEYSQYKIGDYYKR